MLSVLRWWIQHPGAARPDGKSSGGTVRHTPSGCGEGPGASAACCADRLGGPANPVERHGGRPVHRYDRGRGRAAAPPAPGTAAATIAAIKMYFFIVILLDVDAQGTGIS